MIKSPSPLKNYSIVCNEVARREDLSARAKGVYYYLATLPPHWNLTKIECRRHFTEGRSAFNTCFKELEDAGYITKERAMDEKGRFCSWNYRVLWSIGGDEKGRLPDDGKPTGRKTVRRETDRSETGNLLTTDIVTTNKVNTDGSNSLSIHPTEREVENYFKKNNHSGHKKFYDSNSPDWMSGGKPVNNWKHLANRYMDSYPDTKSGVVSNETDPTIIEKFQAKSREAVGL